MSAPPPYNDQVPPAPSYHQVPPEAAAGPAYDRNALSRFFGGPPLTVLMKLVMLSIGVGLVLSVFGIRPWNLIYTIRDFIDFTIANLRVIAGSAWGYFLVGAAVVFPIWLLSRVFAKR